jgi:hypothetical protein
MPSLRKSEIVVATPADFAIMRGGRVVSAGIWDHVLTARAWKRDEVTTDQIIVALTLEDGTEFLVHEDVPGWEDFLEATERALPGMRPLQTWLAGISQPAFARNETLLFERSRARSDDRRS